MGEALDRIAHRGPDGRGIVEVGGAVHGHVRLAIQDPHPRSNQPFSYAGITLAYVGELWNAVELREELISSTNQAVVGSVVRNGVSYRFSNGYRFQTPGDTEVVAAALHRWGPRALEHMDGMFALSWTDGSGTYLARDRFGKVPLYWIPSQDSLFGDGISWASERKAFGGDAALAEAVPPGSVLSLSDGGRVAEYYSLRAALNGREASPGDVRAMLEQGAARRLVSDVPVCCLISGGLDSAAVLALVKQAKPDVVAYHVAFNPESEDLAAAKVVCEALDVPLRIEWIGDPDEEDLYEAVRTVEVPNKTQVEIALLAIPLAARIRADGFRVCLTGEGADEVFGGYGTLARRASSDEAWTEARMQFLGKMARSDFMRVNKTLMAHGVEPRLPFLERPLVEAVLGLGIKACPPGKSLLKAAVADLLPEEIVRRDKKTFQGAAGIPDYCEQMWGPVRKHYNAIAREIFGVVPRD